MIISSNGDLGEWLQKMSSILMNLKDYVEMGNPEADNSEAEKSSFKHRSPVIPDDFRCPISLELMKDPVIVSTGQTYERSCIQKWLDAGHKTCPKTQQTRLHTALTPNYILKSLMALWCESNGVELPKQQGCVVWKAMVLSCLTQQGEKLANGNPEQQRAAAGELRWLAKRNADPALIPIVSHAGKSPYTNKLVLVLFLCVV
ncbi:U-box domain-containing protein 14 [Jatropha curcas]|uniref:U-box domain-containing protein 14 n=1 Tax=Jatropha curcas TaxID=180498 RepID=UPI0018951617|nr:U-box domain-containing protein 14 [Jatropha curcas]